MVKDLTSKEVLLEGDAIMQVKVYERLKATYSKFK